MPTIKLDQAIEKINKKWPDAKYEIIEFSGSTKPFKFKCLKCGRVTEKKHFCNIFQHSKFCYECDRKNYEEQLNKILFNWGLIPLEHYKKPRSDGRGNHHYVKIYCPICKNTWDRVSEDIISKEMKACPYCNRTKSNKIMFEKM